MVREAVSRAKVDPKDIGQCVFGNVIHTEAKDMYLSRVACVNGGLPVETGALTLNRLCGSGTAGDRLGRRNTSCSATSTPRSPAAPKA